MKKEVVHVAREELRQSFETAKLATEKAAEGWAGDAASAFKKETQRFYSQEVAELMRQVDRLIDDAQE